MQIENLENKSINIILVVKWLLAVLFILTFSKFIYRGYTTNDDLEYYLSYYSNASVWDDSFEYAKSNGRFYFIFMQPLFNIIAPNIIPNPLISQTLNLIIIFSSIYFIGLILKKITQSEIHQFVFFVTTLVFINIKSHNNVIVSYPFYFTLSFSFFTFSLLSYITYFQNNKKSWLISSVFFYCFALLFYENYLLYIPLYFFLAIYLNASNTSLLSKIFARKELLFFVATGIIYFLTYYIFKTFFAISEYDGVTVAGNFNIGNIFNTIIGITRGAYPLYNYFTNLSVYHNMSLNNIGHIQNIFTPLINMEITWFIKALLVGVTTYLLFSISQKKTGIIDQKSTLNNVLGLIILIILIYLPQLFISLTVKYQMYADMGMNSYLTTYFSTFPIYILITTTFITIYLNINKQKYKYYFKTTVVIAFSFFSILTDYANTHAALDLKNIHKHFEAVNLLLESKEIRDLPANSIIIAPELYNNKTNISYYNCCDYNWSPYFTKKLNKKIIVLKNDSSLNIHKNINNLYYLGYSKNTREDDQFFTFSKIEKRNAQTVSYLSEDITLFAYSPAKDFALQLQSEHLSPSQSSDSITINNKKIITNNQYFNLHLTYSNRSDFFIPIHVHGNKLDVKSVVFYINTFDDSEVVDL